MDKITFFQLFNEMVAERGNDVLMTYYENGERKSITGNEYVLLTEKYVNALASVLDLKNTSGFIGMRCGNSYEYFAIFFAVLCAGFPVIMLDEHCDSRQLRSFAEQSGMICLISDYPVESSRMKVFTKDDLRRKMTPRGATVKIKERSPEEWADEMAFVTSGTTGNSKIFSFKAETKILQSRRLQEFWKPFDTDYNCLNSNTILQILPFRHCFGFDLAIGFLQFGYELVLPGSIGAMDLIRSIKENNVWMTSMVPAVMKGLNQVLEILSRRSENAPEIKHLLGPAFSTVACAGARLNDEDAGKTCQLGINLLCGWGMTEIGIAAIGVLRDADDCHGYTGRLLPWYEASVRKTSENRNVAEGELLIGGDLLYYGMVKSGKTEPRGRGMFATGDIFRMDDSRNLFFVGRSKSVIIGQSGENVYPEELEELFAPALKNVTLYCVLEKDEMPVLFIDTAGSGRNFDESRMIDDIRKINQKTQREKKIAAVYITEKAGAVTSKGELSRFHAAEYLKDSSHNLKMIALRKGLS